MLIIASKSDRLQESLRLRILLKFTIHFNPVIFYFLGKVVDREFEDEEMEEEEEEDEFGSFHSKEDDSEETKDESFLSIPGGVKRGSDEMSSSNDELNSEETPPRLKPSSESEPSDFVTQPSVNPKPDLREFPRQTNKDTLSILKAKRIIRHNKAVDGPEVKKLKSDQVP